MREVNFYLKKAEKGGTCLIYLQFKFHGIRFKYSFGESVTTDQWNIKKQRVKSNIQTTKDGTHSLNDLMDNLSEVLLSTYRKELPNGLPSKETLKAALDKFINQNHKPQGGPTLLKLIDRFVAGEIKFKGQNKSKETLKKYVTVKNHLIEFEKVKRYPVNFETIDLDFFYTFLSFLQDKGLAPNTIAKDIQVLKTFMNEAFDLGYTKNVGYRHRKFSASWQDVDSVYLSEKELMKLYQHDFSGNKKMEQVRDLFIFGCFTGLRYSDYSTVKPENIVYLGGERFLRINTKKTGEQVIIPCNAIVEAIFEKYADNKNKLPRSFSLQKFNEWIKDVCKDAGLNEKGRLIDKPDLQLWECVSSHTARRSFATNLYLDEYPTINIMKITGHKTEKAFLKYIKISKLDAAKKLSVHNKGKNWSELLLKAV
jgi:integrase